MLKQRNKRQAFAQALHHHEAMIQRIIASYERVPDLQQDLLQDCLLALWQALDHFRQESSMKTYIASICHNRCVDHIAKESRYTSNNHQDIIHEQAICPQQSLQKSEASMQLLNAVRQLPINQRQVISLLLEDFSYKEIADICGLTVSHVGVLINRGKQCLDTLLRLES